MLMNTLYPLFMNRWSLSSIDFICTAVALCTDVNTLFALVLHLNCTAVSYYNPSNNTTAEIDQLYYHVINTKSSTNLHWVVTGKSFFFSNPQRGSLFVHHFAYQLPPYSWHALAHMMQ